MGTTEKFKKTVVTVCTTVFLKNFFNDFTETISQFLDIRVIIFATGYEMSDKIIR